jgi:predicted acylesterase/phospholipase RssA
MEIHIHVPTYLQPVWAYTQSTWQAICVYCSPAVALVNSCYDLLSDTYTTLVNMPSNLWLTIAVLVLVFWPLVLTCVLALATAWMWIFWLLTSVLVGILQFAYAVYQFNMITGDIVGLSLLKSYYTTRQYLKQSVARESTKSPKQTWRDTVNKLTSYEDFLKVRIRTKEAAIETASTSMRRVASFNWQTRSFTAVKQEKTSKMTRSKSYNGNIAQETAVFDWRQGLDPVCIQELGETAVQLLVTTTYKLREAKRRALTTSPTRSDRVNAFEDALDSLEQDCGNDNDDDDDECNLNDSAINANTSTNSINDSKFPSNSDLAYLLMGVVKRNHLKLEDWLVENARAIVEQGQYGLSNPTRKLIRAYYQQVIDGLEWLAEGPLMNKPRSPVRNETNLAYESKSELVTEQDDDDTAQMDNGNSDISNPPDDNNHTNTDADTPRRNSKSHDHTDSDSDNENHSQEWIGSNPQELLQRINLVRKMKQNMGRTALMLSGGGAQAMYHLGTVKALIEANLYSDIKVISGTSGGSITAAMCAIKTPEELIRDVCVPTVSSDYMLNGEMSRNNIRWFPPLTDMASLWFKKKLLVDGAYFRRTCEFYFGHVTFEEAFERTGKHVCITVSASRASGGTAQRLLLNHIATPHVTLASAVAASCALPGVMAPAKLLAKHREGVLEPFEVDGVEWIDGSVQADLPFQRISTLFSVTSFIVSQTNFHVLPLLSNSTNTSNKSMYWRLFETLEWDIRSRALKLSRLGLFPRIFGQDISKVFKQKYHGNLTIVPQFTAMQTLGLKALSNPTVKDMEGYLKYGQIATWPYLNAIRDMIRLEKVLDDCLAKLEERWHQMYPDLNLVGQHDDLESIASSSAVMASAGVSWSNNQVRILGRPSLIDHGEYANDRHVNEHAKADPLVDTQVKQLEQENITLRRELEEMRLAMKQMQDLQAVNKTIVEDDPAQDDSVDGIADPPMLRSEGQVWNMVIKRTRSNE